MFEDISSEHFYNHLTSNLHLLEYAKCSKISNTLKLRTPKIIAENNFQNILKNRTLAFFGKVNF